MDRQAHRQEWFHGTLPDKCWVSKSYAEEYWTFFNVCHGRTLCLYPEILLMEPATDQPGKFQPPNVVIGSICNCMKPNRRKRY